MQRLVQYSNYNREDVHDILSPETVFTPQSGTWGMHGIVKIQNKNADYVFFVTYGQSQGAHTFEEGIDENGILSWQSQPRMSFQSSAIVNFINHDPKVSNIYLFLRTNSTAQYTFMGLLEYVSHDRNRENPVFFKWRIIGWDKVIAQSKLHNLVLNPARISFPISSSSFTWISEKVLVKEMDKSTFLHRGTHIPMEVLDFWNVDLQVGEHRDISVFFHDVEYKMNLVKEVHGRTRLFWKADFIEVIHSRFPEVHEAFKSDQSLDVYPEIRFQKVGVDKYTIDLIDEARNIETLSADFNANHNAGYVEGRLHDYTGTRFERDQRNRDLAIKYHGLTCFGCGFNFGDTYGPLGEGFIEIHHVNPLHQNDNEVVIDPRKDLIPLCSNCHRMVHRSRSETLGIDELKALIKETD